MAASKSGTAIGELCLYAGDSFLLFNACGFIAWKGFWRSSEYIDAM